MGGDIFLFDLAAVQIEAALEAAAASFAVKITVFLFFLLFVHISGDGQKTVIHSDLDLIFRNAGQLSADFVMVFVFPDIYTEGRGSETVVHIKERSEKVVGEKFTVKRATHVIVTIRN